MVTDFQALSLQGTLAFARLAIALLFLGNLAIWVGTGSPASHLGMCAAIICAGASYVSQSAATHSLVKLALAMQLVAILFALWSIWLLLVWKP
jgi:hypothetical protein